METFKNSIQMKLILMLHYVLKQICYFLTYFVYYLNTMKNYIEHIEMKSLYHHANEIRKRKYALKSFIFLKQMYLNETMEPIKKISVEVEISRREIHYTFRRERMHEARREKTVLN